MEGSRKDERAPGEVADDVDGRPMNERSFDTSPRTSCKFWRKRIDRVGSGPWFETKFMLAVGKSLIFLAIMVEARIVSQELALSMKSKDSPPGRVVGHSGSGKPTALFRKKPLFLRNEKGNY